MELKNAIQTSLKTDSHTRENSFLLHSRVSDLVGNDYEAKKAAEEFYRLDAKYEISKAILASAPKPKRRKRKKHTYRAKPMPVPPYDAYVFFLYQSRTLHLSSECPVLKGQSVYRTFYDSAKYSDYVRVKKESSGVLGDYRSHRPPICRCCGHFRPTFALGLIDRIRAFLFHTFNIGTPITLIEPPYYRW